jgi:hypothetical protein
MKKTSFNNLLQSVKEATAIERGARKPSRAFEIKTAKPARKRRMGMDKGKNILLDDWDSPDTNAAIAALFGVGPPHGKS